jgi:hypothetical protein
MAEMMKSLVSPVLFLYPELSCAQASIDTSQFGQSAFSHVTGFGLDTKGGCGGEIIRVTNLEKDGPGSPLEALQTV